MFFFHADNMQLMLENYHRQLSITQVEIGKLKQFCNEHQELASKRKYICKRVLIYTCVLIYTHIHMQNVHMCVIVYTYICIPGYQVYRTLEWYFPMSFSNLRVSLLLIKIVMFMAI